MKTLADLTLFTPALVVEMDIVNIYMYCIHMPSSIFIVGIISTVRIENTEVE